MRRPSGDHAGSRATLLLLVSRVISVPSEFMAYISVFAEKYLGTLSRAETYAMRRPSGDQAGLQSSEGLWVRRVVSEPSAFATYISALPSRSDTKAMRRESGGPCGLPIVIGIIGKSGCTGSVRVHSVYLIIAVSFGYERDAPSVRRPDRLIIVSVIIGKLGYTSSVGARRVYFPVAVSVGYERDAPAVRRPCGLPIASVTIGKPRYR